MPIRRIDDPKECLHPEHYPPSMISLVPGTYEYTCPGCGKVTTIVVHHPSYSFGAK